MFDNTTLIAIVAVVLLMALAIGTGVFKLRPRRLKTDYFQNRWQELQKMCSNAETWPLAVINADKLLDEALKKLRFRGKTMGERLVSAQRTLSDNDSAWYGHKLRNKLVHEPDVKIKERDVKDALMGIRQALKDLGALK
jgi:hypothetical protein